MHYYSQHGKCGFVYIELIYFRHCCHGKSSPRKKIYVYCVSERGDIDSENHSVDSEHRITLCEIYSIKTDNIDWYILIYINLQIGIKISIKKKQVNKKQKKSKC